MADRKFSELLTDQALVERGDAIAGFHISRRGKNFLRMTCDENTSRMLPGSGVQLAGVYSKR
jgi:hypothetical protein